MKKLLLCILSLFLLPTMAIYSMRREMPKYNTSNKGQSKLVALPKQAPQNIGLIKALEQEREYIGGFRSDSEMTFKLLLYVINTNKDAQKSISYLNSIANNLEIESYKNLIIKISEILKLNLELSTSISNLYENRDNEIIKTILEDFNTSLLIVLKELNNLAINTAKQQNKAIEPQRNYDFAAEAISNLIEKYKKLLAISRDTSEALLKDRLVIQTLKTDSRSTMDLLNYVEFTNKTNGHTKCQSIEPVLSVYQEAKDNLRCFDLVKAIKKIKIFNLELKAKLPYLNRDKNDLENFNQDLKNFLIAINQLALYLAIEKYFDCVSWKAYISRNETTELTKKLVESYIALLSKTDNRIKEKTEIIYNQYSELKNTENKLNDNFKKEQEKLKSLKKSIKRRSKKARKTKGTSIQTQQKTQTLKTLELDLRRSEKESGEAFENLVYYLINLAKTTLVFRINKELKSHANDFGYLKPELTLKIFKSLSEGSQAKEIFLKALETFKDNPFLLEDLYHSMQNYICLLSEKFDDPRNKSCKGIEWEVEVTYWIFNMLKQFEQHESRASLRMNQHLNKYGRGFSREFDVVSYNFLAECKNINWDLIDLNSPEGQRLIKQFKEQKGIANSLHKIFSIISKTQFTQHWIEFLSQQEIQFFDPEHAPDSANLDTRRRWNEGPGLQKQSIESTIEELKEKEKDIQISETKFKTALQARLKSQAFKKYITERYETGDNESELAPDHETLNTTEEEADKKALIKLQFLKRDLKKKLAEKDMLLSEKYSSMHDLYLTSISK